MHTTIRRYDRAGGLVDLLVGHTEELDRLFKEIPGFRSYQLVRTGEAECVSLTVFDDAAGSEAGTEAARTWVAANAAHLDVSPPQISAGEVAVSLP